MRALPRPLDSSNLSPSKRFYPTHADLLKVYVDTDVNVCQEEQVFKFPDMLGSICTKVDYE
jgi:hypothetical protein